MIAFFKKIKRIGLRYILTYLIVIYLCKLKVWIYRILLSNLSPELIDTKILQPTQFLGSGVIFIHSAQLGIWPSPNILAGNGYIEARNPSATIKIGKSTAINNSFTIIADKKSIEIGERCLIGPNFYVCDSDFHGLEIENRLNGKYDCESVLIEDDVFIGEGVRILKGVKVGKGSVIGSGSVVVHDVEPHCVYAGVPARKIKELQLMTKALLN